MDAQRPSTAGRLGWFLLYWLGGVATVTVVGYAIKLMLRA